MTPVTAIAGMGILILFAVLLLILAHVFLGLAVYHDAKSWNSESAVMWGLLCGLFGLVPAIIYLVIRGDAKGTIKCPQCHSKVPYGLPNCPFCQLPVSMMKMVSPEESQRRAKLAKTFLILACIFIVVGMVLYFCVFLIPLFQLDRMFPEDEWKRMMLMQFHCR